MALQGIHYGTEFSGCDFLVFVFFFLDISSCIHGFPTLVGLEFGR